MPYQPNAHARATTAAANAPTPPPAAVPTNTRPAPALGAWCSHQHAAHVRAWFWLVAQVTGHPAAPANPAIVRLACKGRIKLCSALITLQNLHTPDPLDRLVGQPADPAAPRDPGYLPTVADLAHGMPTDPIRPWHLDRGLYAVACAANRTRNHQRQDHHDPAHVQGDQATAADLAGSWGYRVIVPILLCWFGLLAPTTAAAATSTTTAADLAATVGPVVVVGLVGLCGLWRGLWGAVACAVAAMAMQVAGIYAAQAAHPVYGGPGLLAFAGLWAAFGVAYCAAIPTAPRWGRYATPQATSRTRRTTRRTTRQTTTQRGPVLAWLAWLGGVAVAVVVGLVLVAILGGTAQAQTAAQTAAQTGPTGGGFMADLAAYCDFGLAVALLSLAFLLIAMIGDSLPSWAARWWHGALSREVAMLVGFVGEPDPTTGKYRFQYQARLVERRNMYMPDLPYCELGLWDRLLLWREEWLDNRQHAMYMASVRRANKAHAKNK